MSENGSQQPRDNKRKHKYYGVPAKRNKGVEVGLKGFLCSCNFKENECVKESYNILNHYVDTFFVDKNESQESENTAETEDVLAAELAYLRERHKRFQVLDSGAKNFLFIKTTLENPVEIVQKIVEDIISTKQQISRYLLRLIPVEAVSKAYVEDIVKSLTPLLQNHFKDSDKSFSVIYNHRNNDGLSRDALIKEIASSINLLNPNCKVDLNNPELSVLVEVIRGYAFLAIIPNFIKYKKFNLISLSQEECENKKCSSKPERNDPKVTKDDFNIKGVNKEEIEVTKEDK
ncbi:THUMP domain-containing protein 1 homolog [Agrilus planipennis]|uniref:THUMP domain-containing protein 1 homolog n=1 Tax=Agrilus planipennis TaxID=224129 RepID=A0A1W4WFJ4_AGRPL|nr:THUMP domain-containing protein 1 homolog [Agrilus planipennis]